MCHRVGTSDSLGIVSIGRRAARGAARGPLPVQWQQRAGGSSGSTCKQRGASKPAASQPANLGNEGWAAVCGRGCGSRDGRCTTTANGRYGSCATGLLVVFRLCDAAPFTTVSQWSSFSDAAQTTRRPARGTAITLLNRRTQQHRLQTDRPPPLRCIHSSTRQFLPLHPSCGPVPCQCPSWTSVCRRACVLFDLHVSDAPGP